MRAIVLAAGEGTRLRPYTLDRPKCLVPLCGRSLLEWHTQALRAAGVDHITIVTGYKSELVDELVDPLGFLTVRNERYASTNMVASLMCARDLLDGSDDVLVTYGDLVFESRVAHAIVTDDAPVAVTVDREWLRLWQLRMSDPLADAETLRIAADGNLIELGGKPTHLDEIEAQYMGVIAIRAAAARDIVKFYDALAPEGPYDGRDRDNMFMTSFVQRIIDDLMPVRAVPVDGGWLEVDTTEDLDTYEQLEQRGELATYCRLGA